MSSSSVILEQFIVLCVVPPESFLLFRGRLSKGIGVGASMVLPDANSNGSIQCMDSIAAGFIFLKLSYCFHLHFIDMFLPSGLLFLVDKSYRCELSHSCKSIGG